MDLRLLPKQVREYKRKHKPRSFRFLWFVLVTYMWVIDDTCSFSKKLKKYLTSIGERFCNPKEYRLFKIEAEKYNDTIIVQPYSSTL